MELLTLWSLVGFLLAAYAVIANDSVQTLGTWMASNNERFNYKVLWAAASAVLIATLWYGWSVNGGDISYGRLTRIPWQEVQWYHAAAPAILVALTRLGVPVSTSFLVLSVFASTFVLEKMLMKSIMGYGVAAAVSAAITAPERQTVCFVGDGGFLMSSSDLATAMHHGAKPLILLIIVREQLRGQCDRLIEELVFRGRLDQGPDVDRKCGRA